MIEKPLYVELPPFYINQSRWKSYQDCDRLYGWLHVEGLEPARPRDPLEIGTATHRALYIAAADGNSVEGQKRGLETALEGLRRAYGKPQLPQDEEQLLKSEATVSTIVQEYFKHWAKMGLLWKPLGLEVAFCVEVGEGSNVFLVGRIDNLVTYMSSLWLVDYKTMGKLDMREFLKYEIDVQLTAYIYGGTKQLSLDAKQRGEPPVLIRGAIVDGLIKTQVPQFHRELYTRTLDDLREFELEFVEKAREIQRKHQRVKDGEPWKVVFPKNTSHCFRYGTCPFRDLCVRDNDVRRLAYRVRGRDYVDDARRSESE